MARLDDSPFPFPPERLYMGRDIPMPLIRRYARAIADEFHPDKIVLFGSQGRLFPLASATTQSPRATPAAHPCGIAAKRVWRSG